ncbi:hypothetical protein OD91_2057 [Lutibacter sp. Hel_I_33_5]|uniref:n-acetylglutamate synthase n=1 Tax=Lutibacter sp. Hel_I_33_5 TaxID=1566289 RepID=UPI0011AA1F62|nr:n-acetylglutamate synthase [Lutibacter sp. Hel_I_33_5]TVZ56759.1 hypothetical protein OD91_2057 [Lutibacter sp. Hel_I_33_5]
MKQEFNFHNKTFELLENSETGKVNSETVFKYKQEGNLVTADYFGGTIKYGKIIATLDNDKLNMLYQCVTNENELKAGKAIAKISLTSNQKIKLSLKWEWLIDEKGKGLSEYLEK